MRRLHHAHCGEQGYGVVLAALLLFFVCVAGVAFLGSYALSTSQRRVDTGTINREVYEAIVGNPELGTFGYLGDSGGYPSNLNLLLVPGTNGPLLRDVPFDNSARLQDGFFGPIEFWRSIGAGSVAPATHGIVIISRGPDHVSSNSASNPNDATLFANTNPTLAGYPTTPDNVDNMVVPDIHATRNAINVGYTGNLTYNFTNRNTSLPAATIGMCPAAYNIEIVSDTRGPAMERLWAPVGATATFELIQGFYTMRLMTSTTNMVYYTEAVTVNPGTTNTRNLQANSVASATMPTHNLRITNQTGANVWIRNPRTGTDIISALANTMSTTVATNACEILQARSAAGGGGTLHETFTMTNANMTKTVVLSTNTFTVAVNISTSPFGVLMVGNPGIAVGSVARLRRKVFTVPAFSRVELRGQNGATLGTITASLTGNISFNQ